MGRRPRVDRTPEEKWQIVLEAMKQRQAAANVAIPAQVTPLTPQAPAAPKRKTIIIDGLESGPKEIPLQK